MPTHLTGYRDEHVDKAVSNIEHLDVVLLVQPLTKKDTLLIYSTRRFY